MKKIALLLSLAILSACGSDSESELPITISDIDSPDSSELWLAISSSDDPKVVTLDPLDESITSSVDLEIPPTNLAFFKSDTNEELYAAQQVAADYSSSQVTIGSTSDLGSKKIALKADASDYTINTYNQSLYHIGRFGLDTIEKLSVNNDQLTSQWNYSALTDSESGSANTYQIVHRDNQFAYLIRYGQSSIEEINVSATDSANFFTGNRIDLSAYNAAGATTPNPVAATIIGSELYVLLQRQDSSFTAQDAYLAVFDISNPSAITEVDTQTNQEELKGIQLNHINPSTMDVQDGFIFIAHRGDYGSNQGGLDVVNTSDYSVTTLIDGDTYPELNKNNGDTMQLYHVTDVSVLDQNTGYATLNIEEGYTTVRTELVKFNPNTMALQGLIDLSQL